MPNTEVIGRDAELGSVLRFVDATYEGPTALVLEGAAGIGKSTLWSAGVEAARERGLRVLSSRPAEADRGLPHAGLGDLFENVLDAVLPALPTPRRQALEAALLVAESTREVDPRTLGVAVRSALAVLAAETPLVLAVDDVQWLDPSSASTVAFALRRLREQPILLLLARRLDAEKEKSGLEQAVERDRLTRVAVGPLSLGAVHRLLQVRLGRTLSRPTLLRVHEISAGNPFYALELARALGADVDPIQPLGVPETLEDLVRARLVGLPHDTLGALLVAAVAGRPSAELLTGLGVTDDVLEPALSAHVIERAGATIGFTHPLLASVIYQGAPEDERRRAHGRVSAVVQDPLDRARHLALSTEDAESEIAAFIEDAAARASARGAPIAAAELGEHALRLTPLDARDDHHRRALAAARAHLVAGDGARARKLALDLVSRTRSGTERAEALVLLAELSQGLDQVMAVLGEALREASGSLALRAVIHRRLAGVGRLTNGLTWAEEQARISLALADELDDDVLRAGALVVLAVLRFDLGDPQAPQLAERAHEIADSQTDLELRREASWGHAHVLVWSVQTDRARALVERWHREWHELDELTSAEALWYLSFIELRAGRWSLATACAERQREVAAQYGVEIPQHYFPVALVALHLGDLARARSVAARFAELAEEQAPFLPAPAAVLGMVDLWSGAVAAAAESFAMAEERATKLSWREPNMRFWRAEYVEALLQLGRVDDALRLLDEWETDALRLGREWVLAHVVRCRGLVAAARGDVAQAVFLLEQAVERHEAVGDPFGRARALLTLGIVRRRARQKRGAREAIAAALAAFEELGAATWRDGAHRELGRIGGRTRVEGLTPAERRVADLVVEGRTNREVAARLFLGERTVASHLTRIYAKVGVRSRSELARSLREDEGKVQTF